MIDNTQPQNDRFWTDALGLVLFSVGAITCSLLTLALMDGPGESIEAISTAAMGHGLLWIGGSIPVGLMGAACLMMGAAQFLGWVEPHRVTRHLAGVLAVAISLSVVLGAFSESAGGLIGLSTGGALASLISPPIAALVGLGVLCMSVWGAWLVPSKATAWEKALEIEKPAVPLQASADGVTTEESAALSFEGVPTAYPGIAASPYPEDVRSRGEIPEGASVLGAEENPNHDEITDERAGESSAGGAPSQGDEVAVEAEPADSVLSLESEIDGGPESDGGPVDDDLVASGPSSGVEEEEFNEPEEDLNEEETELDEEEDSEWEEEELEEEAELEEEVAEESEAEESEELDEEEDSEWEEEELEEAAELEKESTQESIEGQGDLFSMEITAEVPEVVLEPQAAPLEDELDVEEPAESADADQTILMKAADLFLERERVAVSLLQRQFNMDFEECCVILDRLQEMGLIGPYLGGNRRDILLTRDEWLEHVSETT